MTRLILEYIHPRNPLTRVFIQSFQNRPKWGTVAWCLVPSLLKKILKSLIPMPWNRRSFTSLRRLFHCNKSIVVRPWRTSIEKIEQDHGIRVHIHVFGIVHMFVYLRSHCEQSKGLDANYSMTLSNTTKLTEAV